MNDLVLHPDDLYIIPSDKPCDDILVITCDDKLFMFNEISNAQRDFWQHMTCEATSYMITYASKCWTIRCYDDTNLIGEWKHAGGHDSWKRYPIDIEVLPLPEVS